MKAIVIKKPGPNATLEYKDVEKPVPARDEVLVNIKAATVTSGDVVMRKMHPILVAIFSLFGLRKKTIPGHEFSGEIVKAGDAVYRYKAGDLVFGTTTGLAGGANAEYVCVPEKGRMCVLALIPDSVSFGDAAALLVGGMTALYLLKKAGLKEGEKALVYGASGSVGTYAVQLAHHLGASVTGVCSSRNTDLVQSLGAESVIDYKKEDFKNSGKKYDVILDAVGKISAKECKGLLKERGVFVSVRTPTKETSDNLEELAGLLAGGQIRAVIDKRFPLEKTAEAHQYVETGRKRGNVVIEVEKPA